VVRVSDMVRVQAGCGSSHQPVPSALAYPQVGTSTGGHVPTLPWPGWVVRFAQISKSFWRSKCRGLQILHEPEGTQYIFYEHITKVHLSTADCICISGFWGLCTQTSTRAVPLDPAGDFRPPDRCAHPTSKPWLC